MKSLKESLFDVDIVKDEIGTLYDWFGKHIKKFQHSYGGGLGWTHFFQQKAVVSEWKKEGRPELRGGFSKSTFPSDLQKFFAVILNNVIISKKQLLNLNEDGTLDDKELNEMLDKANILLQEDTTWGRRHTIKVKIGYIDGTPAGPGHGVSFREVGRKRFKGLDTENIEISIWASPSEYTGGVSTHVWTLLTDLSIKDFK